MIPGVDIIPASGSEFVLFITQNAVDVDVHALLGGPTAPVDVDIFIDSGVTLNSSDGDIPAVDLNGFALGSSFDIRQAGTIIPAGGNGGAGSGGANFSPGGWGAYGGGGGGGFGSPGGAGGLAYDGGPGAQGVNGTPGTNLDPDASFGADGTSITGAIQVAWTGIFPGQAGGDCFRADSYGTTPGNCTVRVRNTGTMYPGGGGGAGGYWDDSFGIRPAGNGGASGQAGELVFQGPLGQPGRAGALVRYSAGVLVDFSNIGGDIRGSSSQS